VGKTARAIACITVVLLAIVVAPRLALDYTPRAATPEVGASIQLPVGSTSDPVDVTTRYVLPLETAIRSLGDVVGTRGDVGADGATFIIRFRRGADAELKAARLSSELAPLRRTLPEGAEISVAPSGDRSTQPSAYIALMDADAGRTAERVAAELRATPGVQDVTAFGSTEDDVDVRSFGDAPVGFGEAIRMALTPRPLGHTVMASRYVTVMAAASASRIREVRLDGQLLASIASIREHQSEPRMVAKMNGHNAVILAIVRDDAVSLFAFDRAVRKTLRCRNTAEISNDAAELQALLLRVGGGALLIAIVLLLAGGRIIGRGGWVLGAYMPVALALIVNVCVISSLRVDGLGLLMACVAVAGWTPLASWRIAGVIGRGSLILGALFAALPILAVSLAGSALAATLTPPARMFALASAAALTAATLLPQTAVANQSTGRLERHLLRASPAIVLTAVAIATFLLAWFGDRLDPRHALQTQNHGRLFVRLNLAAGTPLRPTLDALARAERALNPIDGIARFWSYASPGRATIVAAVSPDFRRDDRFELLKARVSEAMPLPMGIARVETSLNGTATEGTSDLEEQTFADESGGRYRVLLKGSDATAMRRTVETMTTRLGQLGIRRSSILPEWPEATTQITLVPRPGLAPQMAAQLAQSLAARTMPPRGRTLPDGRVLLAVAFDAPYREDDVPRAADIFARPAPMTVAAAFDIRHDPISGRVIRELGRFVLPIEIKSQGMTFEQMQGNRANADRTLSLMEVPAGMILERPSLSHWDFSAGRLRLFGLAALLPSMLLALAAIALSSIRRAFIALMPGVLGVACTSPALLALSAPLNEVVLLAIGAAAALITALSTMTMARSTAAGGIYRMLRRTLVTGAIPAAAGMLMLLIAGTSGGDLPGLWQAPLLAAGVMLATGAVLAPLLPAAVEILSRRRPQQDAIQGSSAPHLDVRNVTKVYANGFRALHRVSFTLEPGVIGLLGPNGAGKTTLLRLITGLLLPTRGVVRFGNVEVRPETLAGYRQLIGFLPQEFNAYAGMTAEQFLDYWSIERGIADAGARRTEIARLMAVTRLEAHAGRKLRDFSGGMRQRVGIARALIGDSPMLVVDEPTTGLDIAARAHFRELITTLARDRIIILSTHIASDVESTASRLLLLAEGRLVWDGSPAALIARARGRVFETTVSDSEARRLTHLFRITTRVRLAEGVRLRGIAAERESLPGPPAEPSLEEAYLAAITPRHRAGTGSFAFVYGDSVIGD
jgi:ABC-2 type transport system ATP-binding protein